MADLIRIRRFCGNYGIIQFRISGYVMNIFPVIKTDTPLHRFARWTSGSTIALLCNHFGRGQYFPEQLDYLEGKKFCLKVTDKNMEYLFLVQHRRLVSLSTYEIPDVTISGCLKDFSDLAMHKEDADTLFFSRRLLMEGDTDAALYLKNILDALEYDLESHVKNVLGVTVGTGVAGLIKKANAVLFRQGG